MTKVKTENITQIIAYKDLGFDADSFVKKDASVGLSICIRVLMQNWRQGTVGCKDRSEVAFANRKPWKQKGTGRARAGSLRSPLWRKGGVTFGPQERVKILKASKNQKAHVLSALFDNFVQNGKIVCLDWQLENDKPSTKQASLALKSAGLDNNKLLMFVSPHDFQTHASFSNIPNVKMLLFDQPNVFDLADAENWVLLKKDIDIFKEMVSKWI